MSRRRYLSTDISRDKRVAQLAEQAGPIAALLYTWSIPHATDDSAIVRDPEEYLSQIAPNLVMRDVAIVEDAERCIQAALSLGLYVERDGTLHFPDSFYKHQTYIRGDRRGPHPEPDPDPDEGNTQADQPRTNGTSAHSSANQRKSAQRAASFKSSSSFKSSVPTGTVSDESDVSPGDDRVDEIYEHYKTRIQPKARLCPRKKIAARLAKFTPAELKSGIDHFADDPWWMENNAARGAEWFFESHQRSEQFLLMQPRAPVPLRVMNGRAPEPVRHIVDRTGVAN